MARTDPRPNYGSKRVVDAQGYVSIWEPEHPLARADGYIFEHRKVAWDAGILTDPTDTIHHRNGARNDNRPENLEALSRREHGRRHTIEAGVVSNRFGTFPLRPRRTRPTNRSCPSCLAKIPDEARPDKIYCSSGCRIKAFQDRASFADDGVGASRR